MLRSREIKVAGPHEGLCYASKDGEKVEVIAVATHRSHDFTNRKTFVVFKHASNRGTWVETLEEWNAHGFEPITREAFRYDGGRTWSHTRGPWAVVALDKKPTTSAGIGVMRPVDVVWPEENADEKLARDGVFTPFRPIPPKDMKCEWVIIRWGMADVKRKALTGRVYEYREDARRAKNAYCTENGIAHTSAADHFGYDGGYP